MKRKAGDETSLDDGKRARLACERFVVTFFPLGSKKAAQALTLRKLNGQDGRRKVNVEAAIKNMLESEEAGIATITVKTLHEDSKSTQEDMQQLLKEQKCTLEELAGFLQKCAGEFAIKINSGEHGSEAFIYRVDGKWESRLFNDDASAVRQAFELCENLSPAGAFKKDCLANKELPPVADARADTVTSRPS